MSTLILSKPSRALIDGDILVYRIGFACERKDVGLEPDWVARARLNESLDRMMDAVECSDFDLFLTSTDKSNFRFALASNYKANRVAPKPQHYDFLRKVMNEEYGAIVVEGEEADDALGKCSTTDTVICSIDKDLDQIPGWHYNFVKEILYYIEPLEAARWFYQQVLIGDVSDNIKGCPGIGPVKANRILEGCEKESQMLEAVVEQYQNKVRKSSWSDDLLLAGKLLWIRKADRKEWALPTGEVVSKSVLESCLNPPELITSLNPT